MPVVAKGVGDSVGSAGSAVAPGNGAAIATIAAGVLPAGEYEVRVKAGYGATADVIDGMELRKGVTKITSLFVAALANQPPEPSIIPRVTLDGATALSVNASQAGAAGSIYNAELIATRLTNAG